MLFALFHVCFSVPIASILKPFYPPNIVTTPKHLPIENQTQLALETIQFELGIDKSNLVVSHQFIDADDIHHIYIDRLINGIIVSNNNAAVHIKDGKVFIMSSSFGHANNKADRSNASKPTPSVSLDQAIENAKALFPGLNRTSSPPKLRYLQQSSGKISLVHEFSIANHDRSRQYNVYVDAHSGKMVQVINLVHFFKYSVIAIPDKNPNDGFTVIDGPKENSAYSPQGWNSDGINQYKDTRGNNADVHIHNTEIRATPNANGLFESPYNPKLPPTNLNNRQAVMTNIFYLVNKIHDISYVYGFTEASGNFQVNNFGKGGIGNDPVEVYVQESDSCNARFSTREDGKRGVLHMYLCSKATPAKDSGFANEIVIHELFHGVSQRLTGGKANGECLIDTEQSGLGEGWSDAAAVFLLRKPTDDRKKPFAIADWYLDQTGINIRAYPYSTDMSINPYTFSYYPKTDDDEHNIGVIWASMLNEMYWNLVDKYGYSKDWYDTSQMKGNIISMRLLFGGLMLQPCNPNFIQARDAILQADEKFYNGRNQCDIWKAFAKRGLGVDVDYDKYKDGFKLPASCS